MVARRLEDSLHAHCERDVEYFYNQPGRRRPQEPNQQHAGRVGPEVVARQFQDSLRQGIRQYLRHERRRQQRGAAPDPCPRPTRNAVFTIRLSAASGRNVTVKYLTANGTANSTDYAPVTSWTTVTFLPGQTAKTVYIQVKADLTPEPDETFFVKLGSALYATIADSQGLGTIVNDD